MDEDGVSWPPTEWFVPGDGFRADAAAHFTPRPRLAVPLDADGVVGPGTDQGAPVVQLDAAEMVSEAHAARMTTSWARESLRACKRYYVLARECAWMDWAIDKGEEWSPTEADLRHRLAEWWMSGQQAVNAYFHFQQWREKLTGDPVEALVRQLRNSLVHLDEATFTPYSAHATLNKKGKPAGAKDIDRLPDGELKLVFHFDCVDELFGHIDLRDVFTATAAHIAWGDDREVDGW